jgi:hypothetical protein
MFTMCTKDNSYICTWIQLSYGLILQEVGGALEMFPHRQDVLYDPSLPKLRTFPWIP